MSNCGAVALRSFRGHEQQFLAIAAENRIAVVHRPAAVFAIVRRLLEDLVGNGFVEVKLRCEFLIARRWRSAADFKMDMHRPACVPTGIDGEKLRDAFGVGLLIAAQELFAACVKARVAHVRIDAERVAMPNIDDRAR